MAASFTGASLARTGIRFMHIGVRENRLGELHRRTNARAMDKHVLSENLTVHRHASGEGGIFVNAYLVETPNGVVTVDSTLSESESRAFRGELEALGKPLLAVLITHPHPDHVAGITNLVAGESPPILATQTVLDVMRKIEEPKRKQWGPVYGAEWVQRWTYPNTIVKNGEQVTFDGVTYSLLDVGAGGDSESNSVWFITAPEKTAFLGDLTFNGTHAYVADGHLLAWLANLARLERLCQSMNIAFPGHGAAIAPGPLLAAQRDYLLTLAGHVKELADGRPALTDAEKTELERRMSDYLPGAGLGFLIAMNADPIARELSASR
jgi:glyoxylase-like metal-dependent hydrolase (beta-lactamase superfamily II)